MGLRRSLVRQVEGLGIVFGGKFNHLFAGHFIAPERSRSAHLDVLEKDQPFTHCFNALV